MTLQQPLTDQNTEKLELGRWSSVDRCWD